MGPPIVLPDLIDDGNSGFHRLAAAIIAQAVTDTRQRSTFTGQRARADIALTQGLRPWLSMLCSAPDALDAACQRVCAIAGVTYEGGVRHAS